MRRWLPCWIAATLLLAAGDWSFSAQAEAPRFEFVSVRRVPPLCGLIELNLKCTRQMPPRSTSRAFAGGRLEITNQLAIDVVRIAYGLEGVDPRHLSGGPRWMQSERYDIIALTGDDGLLRSRSLTTADVRMMLRGLLEDRFKLRVEVEPKQRDVFVLSRADGRPRGPGLRPSSGPCPEPSFAWDLPECVRVANGVLDAANVSMPEVASLFSRMLRLPVVDETGIDGRYNISMAIGRRDDASVAESLRRDVGLELRRAKRPVDRVEIKSAERPVDD